MPTSVFDKIRILIKYTLLTYGPQIAEKLIHQILSTTTGLTMDQHEQLRNMSQVGGRRTTGGRKKPVKKVATKRKPVKKVAKKSF
jgi:hypothetical protein